MKVFEPMAASSIFLIQAFVIVAVPVVLLRVSGLKGLLPLVAVQIMLGIVLGPSFFGKVAPSYFQMFASPAALSSLTGLATVAVMIFGSDFRPARRSCHFQRQGPGILARGRRECQSSQ